MKKVLVAYATKYGYIEEIAQAIHKKLMEENLEAELLNLEKISSKKWPSINDFDGIIVGSCKGSGFWRKDAKTFIKKNRDILLNSKKPFACFRSDPLDFPSIIYPDSIKEYLEEEFIKTFSFSPPLVDGFGPVFDFSKKSKLDRTNQELLRKMVKKVTKEFGIEIDFKGYNDLRDWDRIQEFALNFANLIGGNKCPECGSIIDPNAEFCSNCGAKFN